MQDRHPSACPPYLEERRRIAYSEVDGSIRTINQRHAKDQVAGLGVEFQVHPRPSSSAAVLADGVHRPVRPGTRPHASDGRRTRRPEWPSARLLGGDEQTAGIRGTSSASLADTSAFGARGQRLHHQRGENPTRSGVQEFHSVKALLEPSGVGEASRPDSPLSSFKSARDLSFGGCNSFGFHSSPGSAGGGQILHAQPLRIAVARGRIVTEEHL